MAAFPTDPYAQAAAFESRLNPASTPHPPEGINPAEWMYRRIVDYIRNFERRLDDKSEIGARILSYSANDIISIEDVGYWGPDMIIFSGRNTDDSPVELLQHISQLNILLVAVPARQEPALRIGFLIGQKTPSEQNKG